MSENTKTSKSDADGGAKRRGPAIPFVAIMSIVFALGFVSTLSVSRIQQSDDADSCILPDSLDELPSISPDALFESNYVLQVEAEQDVFGAESKTPSSGSGAISDIGDTGDTGDAGASSSDGKKGGAGGGEEEGRSNGSADALGCVDDGLGFIPSGEEEYHCDPSDDSVFQGNASVADGANRPSDGAGSWSAGPSIPSETAVPDDGAGSMNGEFYMP